jgi:anti-sigma factor RsiW
MSIATCESFEITIERERYHAASAEERAELATHLEGCDRCRVYAETSERAQRGLAAMGGAAKPEADWAKLESRLRGAGRSRLRRTLLLAGVGPLAVALSMWGLSAPGARVKDGLMLTVIVGAIIGLRIVADVLRNQKLARPKERGEFLRAHREDIARQIQRLRNLRWVALAVVVFLLGLAFATPDLGVRGQVAYFTLAAIAAAVWVERLVVGLPRLRRELETIDGGLA